MNLPTKIRLKLASSLLRSLKRLRSGADWATEIRKHRNPHQNDIFSLLRETMVDDPPDWFRWLEGPEAAHLPPATLGELPPHMRGKVQDVSLVGVPGGKSLYRVEKKISPTAPESFAMGQRQTEELMRGYPGLQDLGFVTPLAHGEGWTQYPLIYAPMVRDRQNTLRRIQRIMKEFESLLRARRRSFKQHPWLLPIVDKLAPHRAFHPYLDTLREMAAGKRDRYLISLQYAPNARFEYWRRSLKDRLRDVEGLYMDDLHSGNVAELGDGEFKAIDYFFSKVPIDSGRPKTQRIRPYGIGVRPR